MPASDDGIYMRPEDVLAELAMTQELDKMWLLVEGKRDVIFYKSLSHNKINNAKIVALNGWENVLNVAQFYPLGQKKQVVGIVDYDYRDLNYPPNIIHSDMHSLESMMFWSSDFRTVMANAIPVKYFAQDKPIDIFLDEIRALVRRCCLPLSKYRLYCYVKSISVSFKGIEHKKFVDDKLNFLVEKAVGYLSSNEGNGRLVQKADFILSQSCENTNVRYSDERYFYHGHDLIGFCSVVLRRKYNSLKSKDELEELFSAVYSASCFKESPMFLRLNNVLNSL